MRVLWLRFLKEVGEDVYKIDPVLLEDKHLKEAVEICEVGAYTPGELEAYDKFWDTVSLDRTLTDNLAEKTQALAEKDQALAETTQALAETTQALEKERIEREKMAQSLAENQKLIEALQKQVGVVRK
jgi:superfamily I DNA and/or RNA helicase